MDEKFTDEEEDEIGAADNGVSCSGGSQRRPSTSIVGRLRVMRPPLRTLGGAREALTGAAGKAGEMVMDAAEKAKERLQSAAEERGFSSAGLQGLASEVAETFTGPIGSSARTRGAASPAAPIPAPWPGPSRPTTFPHR